MKWRQLLVTLGLIILSGCIGFGAPSIPLANGKYIFKHRYAEQPEIESIRLTVEILGSHIAVINSEESSVFPVGIVDEGNLEWHAISKQWIVAHNPGDKSAPEVGGCSDGPSVIDLMNGVYWTC